MNRKNLFFISILASFVGSVLVIIIQLIFKIPFLNKSIPLWILIAALILYLWTIPSIIYTIKTKPKLVFYISSQFPDNQFQASLIQHVIHQLEFHNIHLVTMFPAKNLDAISQKRWFGSILKHKRFFLGGLVVPAYLENHKNDLKKFINSFEKPVLFIDAPPPFQEEEFPNNSAFIGYDNSEGGKLAAKAMCYELSKFRNSNFKILIIASKVVSERQNGFMEHLSEIMRGRISGMECIDDGHFRREDGFEIFKKVLNLNNSDYTSYQGIFCTNDEMALGVMSLINDITHFPKEKVVIIGYDANTEAIELIKSNETPLKNTVRQDPEQLASKSVEKLLKMIKRVNIIKCEYIDPTLHLKIPEGRKRGRCESAD